MKTLRIVAGVMLAQLLMVGAVAQQPLQPAKEFKLTVTAADVEVIGKALEQMPYHQVAPLMIKLQQQLVGQNEQPKEAKKEETKKK